MTEVRGFVVHWIGAAQSRAQVIRDNFDRAGSRQGSTQYVIDWDTGGIIQTMPENEVAFHVGANKYTAAKTALCGASNPNNFLLGAECCIGDQSITGWETSKTISRPSDKQYAALVELAADVCVRYSLDPAARLFRHYDITGKRCHVWFVNNPDKWERFKQDVAEEMEVRTMVRYKTLAEVPVWGREAVQARITRGSLKGDPVKGLDLSEDMVRLWVIQDRDEVLKK